MSTTDKMGENSRKYRERVEALRADYRLSEEARREELAGLYEKARGTHERLAEEYRAGIREDLKKTRKAVFAAPTVGADGALNMLAYRDALDRTERKTDPRELSEMLARAEVTGDHALARACLYRGFDLPGDAARTSIVQSYFAKYPDELPKWEAFMGAAEAHNELEAMGVSVPAPEEPRELIERLEVLEEQLEERARRGA
jgi:hypothetical protein